MTQIDDARVELIGEGTYGTVWSKDDRVWKVLKHCYVPDIAKDFATHHDAINIYDRELAAERTDYASALTECSFITTLCAGKVCILSKSFVDGRWSWSDAPTRMSRALVCFENGEYQPVPLTSDHALSRVEEVAQVLRRTTWPANVLPVEVKWVNLLLSSGHFTRARVLAMPRGTCFRLFVQKLRRQHRKEWIERFVSVGIAVIERFHKDDIRHVDMTRANWVVTHDENSAACIKLADHDAGRAGDGPLSSCATYSPVDPEDFWPNDELLQGRLVQNFLMAWCFACACCEPELTNYKSCEYTYATDYISLVAAHHVLLTRLADNRDAIEPLLSDAAEFADVIWGGEE